MEEARRGKEKVSDLDPRGDFGDDDGPADIDALRPAGASWTRTTERFIVVVLRKLWFL